MDGIHDMGGTEGWGRVDLDAHHVESWRIRAWALGALSPGLSGTNSDAFRHAIERQHPLDYLRDGYHGRWLGAAETLLVETGMIPGGAVDARARTVRGQPVTEPTAVTGSPPACGASAPGSLRPGARAPRFAVGDRVRTRPHSTPGHTRLPRYIRGHAGTVIMVQPCQVLPDTNAHFQGENAQAVYSVQFTSEELWGPGSERFRVAVDCYEDYLEPAP